VLTALRMAATCAILAPAGPQRSRMLGTLYKDERSRTLQHFSVLEKMFMDRLLRPEEVASFASELATHQKATVEDGSTVLDKAVREHNMIATSHLYTNISFAELGALLGIEAGKAERMAAAMLCEKRLAGSIDQPSSRIHFEHKPAGADTAGGTADALHAFDAQVEGICRSVESIAGAIGERFPEYAMAAGAGGAP
jgi:COP9 signalosome complex subunit 4